MSAAASTPFTSIECVGGPLDGERHNFDRLTVSFDDYETVHVYDAVRHRAFAPDPRDYLRYSGVQSTRR